MLWNYNVTELRCYGIAMLVHVPVDRENNLSKNIFFKCAIS